MEKGRERRTSNENKWRAKQQNNNDRHNKTEAMNARTKKHQKRPENNEEGEREGNAFPGYPFGRPGAAPAHFDPAT